MLIELLFAGILLIVFSVLLVLTSSVLLGEFYRIRTLASILFSFGLSLAVSSNRIPANLEKNVETAFRFVAFAVIFTVTFFLLEGI